MHHPLIPINSLSEEQFLRHYDPTSYDRFSVSVDIVIFSIDSRDQQENYRKLDEQKLTVLLLKRSEHPYLGKWSLPGGFVSGQESLDQAVNRVLKDKTGLSHMYTEQLYTFGHPQRDPRTRIVSTAYLALIDRSQYQLKRTDIQQNNETQQSTEAQQRTDIPQNTEAQQSTHIRSNLDPAWFEIDLPRQGHTLRLTTANPSPLSAASCLSPETLTIPLTATEFRNGKITSTICTVPDNTTAGDSPLAFDHASVLLAGLLRIRNKIDYTDIIFNLLPDKFTITHLQQIHEIILGEKLLAPVFRRKISGKIQPTGEYSQERGHRPSQFYRYRGSTAT